jgi:hypothetical protein
MKPITPPKINRAIPDMMLLIISYPPEIGAVPQAAQGAPPYPELVGIS